MVKTVEELDIIYGLPQNDIKIFSFLLKKFGRQLTISNDEFKYIYALLSIKLDCNFLSKYSYSSYFFSSYRLFEKMNNLQLLQIYNIIKSQYFLEDVVMNRGITLTELNKTISEKEIEYLNFLLIYIITETEQEEQDLTRYIDKYIQRINNGNIFSSEPNMYLPNKKNLPEKFYDRLFNLFRKIPDFNIQAPPPSLIANIPNYYADFSIEKEKNHEKLKSMYRKNIVNGSLPIKYKPEILINFLNKNPELNIYLDMLLIPFRHSLSQNNYRIYFELKREINLCIKNIDIDDIGVIKYLGRVPSKNLIQTFNHHIGNNFNYNSFIGNIQTILYEIRFLDNKKVYFDSILDNKELLYSNESNLNNILNAYLLSKNYNYKVDDYYNFLIKLSRKDKYNDLKVNFDTLYKIDSKFTEFKYIDGLKNIISLDCFPKVNGKHIYIEGYSMDEASIEYLGLVKI